jgi:hypothetical protein
MAALGDIRKFQYQNPTSGKVYSVCFKRNLDETVDVVATLIGDDNAGFGTTTATQVNDDPEYDNTEVAAVVITTKVGTVFGVLAKTDEFLATAAIYDASVRGAGGALLSTLAV